MNLPASPNEPPGRFLMGCGAGFSGDRIDAPLSVVDAIARSGRPGALMFETLAERTLALGHVARRTDPALGYEPLLAELVGPVLAPCAHAGIPIIGNFGAANPPAAAALLQRLAREAGLPDLRIAIVTGDDVRDAITPEDLEPTEGDASLAGDLDPTTLIAANVYLGAQPIAEALRRGAQVVVTGRVADPALALGPSSPISAGPGTTGTASPPGPSSATCSNAAHRSPAATSPTPATRTFSTPNPSASPSPRSTSTAPAPSPRPPAPAASSPSAPSRNNFCTRSTTPPPTSPPTSPSM